MQRSCNQLIKNEETMCFIYLEMKGHVNCYICKMRKSCISYLKIRKTCAFLKNMRRVIGREWVLQMHVEEDTQPTQRKVYESDLVEESSNSSSDINEEFLTWSRSMDFDRPGALSTQLRSMGSNFTRGVIGIKDFDLC